MVAPTPVYAFNGDMLRNVTDGTFLSIDSFINTCKGIYPNLSEGRGTPILPGNTITYVEGGSNSFALMLYYPRMVRHLRFFKDRYRSTHIMDRDMIDPSRICRNEGTDKCEHCDEYKPLTIPPEVFIFICTGSAEKFTPVSIRHFNVIDSGVSDNTLYTACYPGNTFDNGSICWGGNVEDVFKPRTNLLELQGVPEKFYGSPFNSDLTPHVGSESISTGDIFRRDPWNKIYTERDYKQVVTRTPHTKTLSSELHIGSNLNDR